MRARPQDAMLAGPWALVFAAATIANFVLWYPRERDRAEEELAQATAVLGAPNATNSEQAAEWFVEWLGDSTGAIPDAPDVQLGCFPGVPLQGLDLLNGEDDAARATRAELARWSASGELPMQLDDWSLHEDVHGTLRLELTGQGDSAETLATLQHLLAARGEADGYLTDPARVEIESEGRRLNLRLHVRIWPLSSFLPEEQEAPS